MTNMRSLFLVATAVLLALGNAAPALAGDARPDCLKLETPPGGKGAYMRNVCNKQIYVVWCVQNPKSSFNCARQPYGATDFQPGKGGPIVDYAYDGGGKVFWAVCTMPGMVRGWKGPGTTYTCTAK